MTFSSTTTKKNVGSIWKWHRGRCLYLILQFQLKIESLRWKKVIDRWKTVKRRKRRQGTNKPGLVLEVVPRVPECVKCQQHPVFQGGHPSKHWLSSSLLNLGDHLVTGLFNSIWPLTNVWRQYRTIFKMKHQVKHADKRCLGSCSP